MNRALAALAALMATLLACGGAQTQASHRDHLELIPEGQALAIVADVVREAGLEVGPPFAVDIGAARPLEVDARVGQTRFGIEWVSPQDHADYGEAIPTPPADGSLLILPGRGDDNDIEVLVLDAPRYRFDPDPDAVYGGALSPNEAEARLRRDVRDFLEYCRGQL